MIASFEKELSREVTIPGVVVYVLIKTDHLCCYIFITKVISCDYDSQMNASSYHSIVVEAGLHATWNFQAPSSFDFDIRVLSKGYRHCIPLT